MVAHLLILAAGAAPLDYYPDQEAWMPDEPAEPVAVDEPPYQLSLRLQLGLGAFGYNANVGGEGWLGEHVGVGAHMAAFGGVGLFSGGKASSGYGGGPVLALRTSSWGSYGLLLVGVGIARSSSTVRDSDCEWGWDYDDCAPPQTRSGEGLLLNIGLGWVWHPGGIELGPILRLDATDHAAAITLNLAVGFAAR